MDLESKWKPILIGGLITGLGPLVPFVNLLCCLFPLIGAFVAVAVYRSSKPSLPLTNNDGIVLGTLSAVIGAILHAIVLIPLVYFVARFVGGLAIDVLPALTDASPVLRSILERVFSNLGSFVALLLIARILAYLAFALAFGIIGGLIGVAILARRAAGSPTA